MRAGTTRIRADRARKRSSDTNDGSSVASASSGRMSKSDLERSFEYYARIAKLPNWECEFLFHPTRKWRIDFAWPDKKIGAEGDGGNHMVKWSKKLKRHVVVGRHTKDGDYEKLNSASELGWLMLRFTPTMLSKDPMGLMDQIKRVLIARQECEQRSTVATSKRVTSKDPAASKEVGSS